MKKKFLIFIIVFLVIVLLLTVMFFLNTKKPININDNTEPSSTITSDTNAKTLNEDEWIVSISPTYLNGPANTVYIYKNSYVITNSSWQDDADKIHKKGKLSSDFENSLLSLMENDICSTDDLSPWYKVTLNSGEVSFLKRDSKFIDEIEKLINYTGTIWYAEHDN